MVSCRRARAPTLLTVALTLVVASLIPMAPSPVEEHEAGAGAAWGPGGGRGGARPSLLLSGVGATAPPPELEAVVLARMRVASPVEIAKPKPAVEALPRAAMRRSLAQTPAPMRIKPTFQLRSSLDEELKSLVQDVTNAAILTLRGYMQVREPTGPSGLLVQPRYVSPGLCDFYKDAGPNFPTCSSPGLTFSFEPGIPDSDVRAPMCGEARVDASHVMSPDCCSNNRCRDARGSISCSVSAAGGPGLLTDLHVYVMAEQASCQPTTAAYALPCVTDPDTGRPIMGMLNLCPATLQSGLQAPDKLLATVVHELMHVLGMTSSFYPSFIDLSTGRRWEEVVREVPRSTDLSVRSGYSMIVTPTVAREVRAQFGCDSISGAALEDDGDGGSMNSHWEHELFQGDIMTPQPPLDASERRVSRITLALMEDTGWYVGNWSAAPYLDWGRNATCAMPTLSCAAFRDTVPDQPYFCNANEEDVGTCTFDGRSHGICLRANSITFSDCGLVLTQQPGFGVPARSRCISDLYMQSSEGQAARAAFGWVISPSSRCLRAQLPLLSDSGVAITPRDAPPAFCWAADCDADGTLYYNIAGVRVACPPGETLPLSSISPQLRGGSVTCPSSTAQRCISLACPAECDPVGGECSAGACVCRLGFQGAACNTSLIGRELPDFGFAGQDGLGVSTTPPAAGGPGGGGGGGGVDDTTVIVAVVVAVVMLLVTLLAVAAAVVMHRRRAARHKAAEAGTPAGGPAPQLPPYAMYTASNSNSHGGYPPYNSGNPPHSSGYAPHNGGYPSQPAFGSTGATVWGGGSSSAYPSAPPWQAAPGPNVNPAYGGYGGHYQGSTQT